MMAEAEGLYSSYIANCVFNALLCYTAILLNGATIYAIRKTSSLPKPFKTLLLSLAVSDLGVGLLVQPLYIAILVMKMGHMDENYPPYNTAYTTFLTTMIVFAWASFFSVTALSADRFLAIHLHLRYRELVTHKRAIAVVMSIWIFSAAASFLFWIPEHAKHVLICFTVIEIVCIVIVKLLYYKIYLIVRHHTNQIQSLQVRQEAQNGDEMAHLIRMRNSAVSTFYVCLVFLACYLPGICGKVVAIISGVPTAKTTPLSFYSWTLVFLNSSLNPLIYCWKMRHIRHAVVSIPRNIFLYCS